MVGTAWAQKISLLAQDFGMVDGLIILDHFQGFASGDMNKSETGTAMCREANSIVEATKAAVVFAAHIPKSELKATGLSQGMAAGSLTYENAMRQLAGLLPMSEDQAKQYGLEELRTEFMWLGMPKNSYGSTDGGIWLRKVYVPEYHTIRVEPVELKKPIPQAKLNAHERLIENVLMYLDNNPWTTKNMLDKLSGTDGQFKATRNNLRDALASAIDEGRVYLHQVTAEERKEHKLAQQVKEVLRVK